LFRRSLIEALLSFVSNANIFETGYIEPGYYRESIANHAVPATLSLWIEVDIWFRPVLLRFRERRILNNRLTGGGTVITRLAVVSIMIARGELSGFVEAGMAFLKTL
jgi:hypothetical protein